jgi:hypothetical protein
VGVEGLDAARTAWKDWHAGSSLKTLPALADHLEKKHETFTATVEHLKKGAAARLKQIEDRWKPLAEAIAVWIPPARTR